MVRDFSDEPLAPDLVDRILASALRAPSAGFAQGWAFLALTDEADRARFWPFIPNQTPHFPGMMNAPLIVIPLAHKDTYVDTYAERDGGWDGNANDWPAPYWYIYTGMATLLMLLTAVDEGLGGFFFWIMPPYSDGFGDGKVAAHLDALRTEFGIPDGYDPIGAVAIGYRSRDLAPQRPGLATHRREPGAVIHRGHWRAP
jgi:nitroreductase